MNALLRCIELMDRNRIHYTHTRHANAYRARDIASAEHVPVHKLAQTVVFCADDFCGMAVLPADCVLDLDELARGLGLHSVRLATEAEAGRLFPDCEVGAMPPFGKLFNLPVYVDERLAREKHMVFSAGTHRDTIHMQVADYLRVAEPLIMRFATRGVGVS